MIQNVASAVSREFDQIFVVGLNSRYVHKCLLLSLDCSSSLFLVLNKLTVNMYVCVTMLKFLELKYLTQQKV